MCIMFCVSYHHLLHGLSSLRIQIREFAVLRFHLLSINFRVTLYYGLPPLHLVVLCEQYGKSFSILYKM